MLLLKIHPQKCNVLRLSLKKTSMSSICCSIGDRRISVAAIINDLGITFNQHLPFERHIKKKVNEASSLASITRRLFVYLDKEIFWLLCISTVRPHVEYGPTVWNPPQKHLIKIIGNVQCRALKLAPGIPRVTCTERLKVLDLATPQFHKYQRDMIEFRNLFHHCYNQFSSQTMMKSAKTQLYKIK